jgi:hypothetical protein
MQDTSAAQYNLICLDVTTLTAVEAYIHVQVVDVSNTVE